MNCITDTDLPVRIQAAIALPELVRYEKVRAKMLPSLGRILQGEPHHSTRGTVLAR